MNVNSGVPATPGVHDRRESDDRYDIIDARRGGMGIVYLCHDRVAGRPVALKTFLPQYLNNPATRIRFLQEATSWVEVGFHPHIVPAYRVEQLGRPPQPYVVLEWIVGRRSDSDPSLATRLYKRPPLPFKRSLRYALHIARGMRHARKKIPGLVHRDLKPGNILIDANDAARVSDFGLARVHRSTDGEQRHAGNARNRSKEWRAPGTAPYCAPEQWEQSGSVDERTDIYALGCIVYEMLTGQRAAAGGYSDIRNAHLDGRLAPIPRELPQIVAEIIRGCTALSPDDRFAGWADVEARLSDAYKAIADEPPPAVALSDNAARETAHGDTYRALARSFLDLGHWRTAADCLEHSIALARREGDAVREAEALHDRGLAAMQGGRPAEAVTIMRQALAIARKSGVKRVQSEVLSSLGGLRSHLGFHGRACAALRISLRLARQLKDDDAELIALGNLANACAESGDPRRAVDNFQHLLTRLAEQPAVDPVIQQRVHGNLGTALLALDEPERAIPHLQSAHELAVQCGEITGRLHILRDLCEALAAHGCTESLHEWAQTYLQLALDCGDLDARARAKRYQKSLQSGEA